MSAHRKLSASARKPGNKHPAGFIYEDIYEVVLRLFRTSYLRSLSCNYNGTKMAQPVSAMVVTEDKVLVKEYFRTLSKFMEHDPTLAARIEKFQIGLKKIASEPIQ